MAMPALAQFNLKKAVSGVAKVAKAETLADEQMAERATEEGIAKPEDAKSAE